MSGVERWAIAGALGYLIVLGAAMQRLSYDLWGALVVVPVLVVVSVPLVRRAFSGPLEGLRPYVWVGMAAKFAGAVAGYSVRFDAYGGSADAGEYHAVGKVLAGDVRAGLTTPFAVLPSGSSTAFVEELTGFVYTIFGSSRLGGFIVFSWFSFWGLVFFVKAASVAIPGLASRRYALLLFIFPSLVYWGSSIGKEAVVGFFLGLASYGVALVLAEPRSRRLGFALAVAGLIGAARVRPHFAAIWAGAAAIALVFRVLIDAGRRDEHGRLSLRLSTLVLTVIAVVGFGLIATATLEFLPDAGVDDEAAVTEQLGSIFDEVERRTAQGGSFFTPVAVDSPRDFPYAAFRTLSRPLLIEARSLAELLPALEMTGLLLAVVFGWRRFLNLPRLFVSQPYITFVVLCLVTFGVAFASIGNLGILVRQRSLVLPLLLVLWCVPPMQLAKSAGSRDDAVRVDLAHV